jgi:hypothetical protein
MIGEITMAFEDTEKRGVSLGGERAMVDHLPPTVTEKLVQERNELELRLRAIDELLEQLEANPETQKIIDSLAKLGRGMF